MRMDCSKIGCWGRVSSWSCFKTNVTKVSPKDRKVEVAINKVVTRSLEVQSIASSEITSSKKRERINEVIYNEVQTMNFSPHDVGIASQDLSSSEFLQNPLGYMLTWLLERGGRSRRREPGDGVRIFILERVVELKCVVKESYFNGHVPSREDLERALRVASNQKVDPIFLNTLLERITPPLKKIEKIRDPNLFIFEK